MSNQLANFKLTLTDGVSTMSSLDVVDFINEGRKSGEGNLRHDCFMVKAKKIISVAGALTLQEKFTVTT